MIQNPKTIKEFSEWNRSFFPVEVPEDIDSYLNMQEYHDFFKSWMNCTKEHYYFSNAL